MKDISSLGNDLRKFLYEGKKQAKNSLAREVLDHASPKTPYDTGRLRHSGFAFVDGALRFTSGSRQFHHFKPSNEEDVVTFLFSTPKPASKGANEFYIAAGGKWFDYAYIVSQPSGSRINSGEKLWINTTVKAIATDIIGESFRRVWKSL